MISIITPSFNRSYIIDETAQSIFAQSDHRWEWIIVDDGSTDDSWEKIQGYAKKDDRVKAFRRDRGPKGACTCRNIGATKSKGKYLIFLDTDDIIGKDAVANRLAHIASPRIEGKITYFPIVTFEKTINQGFYWDDIDNPVSWLTSLFSMTPPCQGTAPVWKKSDFLSIGGWREDLKVWQDVELHIRAYAEGFRFQAAHSIEPDIFLRLSPDSISHVNFHAPEKALSRWDVVKYCIKTFPKSDLTPEEIAALQTMALSVFQNILSIRHYTLAREIMHSLQKVQLLTIMQLKWMREALIHHKLRLYKIRPMKNRLNNTKNVAFPSQIRRKLGSQKWEQKSV
ncbi:glycosyltransferase family 2 protein [Flavobacteriales bacterium]|nr:glycosyltransferase family 2 protein [Flavobacteriales bacterium]